ncbi:MAG TPA: DUF177 domain-containing protein [Candidatus Polarisedimenticolaceae bacterium]|nr:DUF177 domain-containing protein [Candidatus Polarisedimenticolaceae bacterium]
MPARLAGSLSPGGRGPHLEGSLEAVVPLTCSRCLEPFPWSVHSDFDLVVVREEPALAEDDDELDEDAAEALVAPEGKIGLEDLAKEQLYLNLPLKPICRPDCKGLCTSCGANRNTTTCGCATEAVDPRMAPLLEFRKKKIDS